MSAALSVVALLLHAALMLAAAPTLTGVLRSLRARLRGRVGPSPLQPWRDLARLARKQPVVAEGASFVFTAAPIMCCAATAAGCLLVPSFGLGLASAPVSDLLVLAGLLGTARAALALAGLDVGTAIGGLGAGRALSLAACAAPALLLVAFTLALLAGTTNLDAVIGVLREGAPGLHAALALVLAAAVAVAVVDTARAPADSPGAPFELAMLGEAMALEYSGWHLALLEAAAMLRLLLWVSLLAAVFAPAGIAAPYDGLVATTLLAWLGGLLAWVVKLGVLAIALAVLEVAVARMRLVRVPEVLGIALLLGLLAAVVLFVSQGFA